MPVTPQQVREALIGLSPDEQDQFLSELERRQTANRPGGEVSDLPGGGWDQTPPSPPRYQQSMGRIPAIPGLTGTPTELPSAESMADALPLIGGVAGTAASPGVGSAAGAVIGESARQLLRRHMGAPASPGLVQGALGLDPNSTGAAIAGFGGEAAASGLGAGASKLLRAISGGAKNFATRGIIRDILGGARTEREVAEAPALARRAQAVGVLRSFTTRGRQARAQAALDVAKPMQAAETAAARATGRGVEAMPVLESIQDELPSSIPGTVGPASVRQAAAPERRATLKVLNDELKAISNTGGGATGSEIPLDVALEEISALEKQLAPMYKRGALDPAYGKAATQAAEKTYRAQLRKAFPELGDARMKTHELSTITTMLQRGIDEGFSGRGSQHAVATMAGAAAAGYMRPAASGIAGAAAHAVAPLSIPAAQLFSRLAAGGAHTAQLWIRAMDLAGWGDTTDTKISASERHRRAQRALQQQAEGVVSP